MSQENCTASISKATSEEEPQPNENEAVSTKQSPNCAETAAASAVDASTTPTISKKQMKRILRNEKWIAGKAERRKREKERRKARKAKLIEEGGEIATRKQRRDQLVKQCDSPCKVTVVIDCDYADYMNEAEIKKLCKQLNWCYFINKHSAKPVQLYVTSLTGTVKESLEKYQSGYRNWDAHCTEKHWKEVFQASSPSIVYLTGDSPDTVAECKQIQEANNGIFIIGGLIDHNRHKGLALERAQKFDVAHGQLPIGEHIRMTQRKILAIPHVFEIMLYAANGTIGHYWSEIFQKVIPSRKIASEAQ